MASTNITSSEPQMPMQISFITALLKVETERGRRFEKDLKMSASSNISRRQKWKSKTIHIHEKEDPEGLFSVGWTAYTDDPQALKQGFQKFVISAGGV